MKKQVKASTQLKELNDKIIPIRPDMEKLQDDGTIRLIKKGDLNPLTVGMVLATMLSRQKRKKNTLSAHASWELATKLHKGDAAISEPDLAVLKDIVKADDQLDLLILGQIECVLNRAIDVKDESDASDKG